MACCGAKNKAQIALAKQQLQIRQSQQAAVRARFNFIPGPPVVHVRLFARRGGQGVTFA